MKAIEQLSVFHGKAYHQRFFRLEFGSRKCRFYESESKVSTTESYRVHKQSNIVSCEVMEDEEIEENRGRRERERSNSFLRRAFAPKATKCGWNFAFKLSFKDKDYELYAPTRQDRTQWVRILSAIAEMN